MKTLRELWAWDGIDYLIQIALICLFVYGSLYAYNANETLTEDGCKAYWQEYNPGTNLSEKRLVNKTEASRLKSGGPAKLDLENNYSDRNKFRNIS